MCGTRANQIPENWESETFAFGTHEKGSGYFLDSENMGRWSWFVRSIVGEADEVFNPQPALVVRNLAFQP